MSFLQRLPTADLQSSFEGLKKKTHHILNRFIRFESPDASELPDPPWPKSTTTTNIYSPSNFDLPNDDDDIIVYSPGNCDYATSSSSSSESPSDITSVASLDSGPSNATEIVSPLRVAIDDLPGPQEHSQNSPTPQAFANSSHPLETLFMSLWLSRYMSELVMGNSSAYTWYTSNLFSGMSQFYNLLDGMQLKPETVICALFYVNKLFPNGFVFDSATPRTGIDINTLTVRIFTLGCMLATKWTQDDDPDPSWWASYSGISTRAFNRLEKSALGVFNYNISISPSEFLAWNIELCRHSSMVPGHPSSNFVRQLLERNIAACVIPMRGSRRTQVLTEDPLMEELYWGLMQVPEPAEWRPEVDPVVSSSERRSGTAPCRPSRAIYDEENNHLDYVPYSKRESQVDYAYHSSPRTSMGWTSSSSIYY